MKILVVAGYYKPAYIYGGPTRSVPSLCEGMVKAGAQVTVYTSNANGPKKTLDVLPNQPINVDGVEVIYHSLSGIAANIAPYFFYSSSLRNACTLNTSQFDAVYIPGNWTYPVLISAKSALASDVPYLISPRGSLMDWSMSQGATKKRLYLALFERKCINGAAAIHTTCSLEGQQLQKWNFEPPTVSIPNGINSKVFASLPPKGKLRDSFSIPQDATVSLFVGRLHKMKRLDLIIDAFSRVIKHQENTHLIVVGSDQDGRGEIAMAQVHRLGLTKNIHFTGLLAGTDLLQAYADSDLLVLLSHRENFGMVAVEAMAAGLPVLLSNQVGLAEEVQLAQAGLATESGLDDICTAWLTLLSNSSLRQTMGERGRQLVLERFDSEVVARKMLELFASVANKHQ